MDEPTVIRSAADLAELPAEVKFVRGESLTDADLEGIARLGGLEGLYLDGCFGLGDGALAHVGTVSGLRELYTSGQRITDEGLRHLAKLAKLEVLGLDAPVTGAGFAHLSRLEALRQIHLPACRELDPANLSRLAALPALRELCLYSVERMDDGWLGPIGEISGLESLRLVRCPGVTEEGLARLRMAAPDLNIRRDG